jgi:hypothetical protein
MATNVTIIRRKFDPIVPGAIFERLTVIKEDVERIFTNRTDGSSYKLRYWICKCECGSIISTMDRNLKTGKTKSCGCYSREMTSLRGMKYHLPFEAVFANLKNKAGKRNIEVTLTLDEYGYFARHYDKCHYCHANLKWLETGNGCRSRQHNLDRMVNTIGYVFTNCVPCCARCNRGKSDKYTYQEWMNMTACYRGEVPTLIYPPPPHVLALQTGLQLVA